MRKDEAFDLGLSARGEANGGQDRRAVTADTAAAIGGRSVGAERSSTATPGERCAIFGQEISLRFSRIDSNIRVEHQPIDLIQIGVLFGPSVCVVSSRDRSGEPHELRLVGANLYVVPAGVAHTTRSETKIDSCSMLVNDGLWRRVVRRDVWHVLAAERARHDVVIWTSAFLLRHLSVQQATAALVDFLGCSLLCRLGELLPEFHEHPAADGRGLSEDEQRRVLEFMQRNLRHNIHVDDFARQTGHCTAHFTELFTQTMGCSPFRYLKELRMRTARELLVNGGISVREAACSVGYLNLDHFTEVFRKFWGTSPRAFLDQLRASNRQSPGRSRETPGEFPDEGCQGR